ncbi:MAG: hypothetical protein ACRDK2_05020, partial [Solirubrobacteraceae bacterium]
MSTEQDKVNPRLAPILKAPALRRSVALVFAGDRRVWRAAAVCAVPLVALILVYCLKPRSYLTGTNNVETYTYIAPTP